MASGEQVDFWADAATGTQECIFEAACIDIEEEEELCIDCSQFLDLLACTAQIL